MTDDEIADRAIAGMREDRARDRPVPCEKTAPHEGPHDWPSDEGDRICDGVRAVDDAPDSWAPIDLGPYLRGEVKRAEPALGLARSDGLRLIYPGKEHAVIGEMESGKSWYCLACVAAELAAGNHVVYVHFEEADPSDTVERLVALDVRATDILERFRFVGPERQGSSEVLARLLDPVPSLVVFDGVNEAMSLHRWGIRDEDGAADFRRHLVKPCTAAGAAVLACDHVVKDREARGRNALGSIHKGNGLTGSLILLENADPFGRGQCGRSHVYVTKDRPGYLRRHGNATKTPGKTFMGELTVDDTHTYNPWLELTLWAPVDKPDEANPGDPHAATDDAVLEVAREIITARGEASGRTIRAKTGISKEKTADALERLVLAGRLTDRSGPRNSRLFDLPATADVSGPVPRRGGPGPVHSDDRSALDSGPLGTTRDHSTDERGDAA